MVRDPVCGIYVVPDRALALTRRLRPGVLLLRRLPRQISAALRAHRMTLESGASRRHRRSRPPHVRPRDTPTRTPATSASASAPDRLLMTPKSVCKGFMTPDMMCITDLDGREAAGRSRSLDRNADAPRGLPAAARRPGRRSRPPADGHRFRGRGHPARSRGARRSADDAREHSDRRVRDTVHIANCPMPSASTSRRTTACCWRTTAR